MNRIEFCDLLLTERQKAGASLYFVQKKMRLTFQQAKRIESGENNFNLNKAIEFLSALNCVIELKNAVDSFYIRDYSSFVKWLIDTRTGRYSQRTLAEAAQCSCISIANTECKKSVVSIDVFLKIVNVLGFTVNFASTNNE